MKKRYFLLIVLAFFAFLVYLLFVASKSVHSPAPSPGLPNDSLDPIPPQEEAADIIVTSPQKGGEVGSPIFISGKAKGNWYFEGTFPITLTNWDGLIIAEGHAKATENWMSEGFVPFTASLSYDLPEESPYTRGFLILKNDNPSGEPTRDKSIEIEVELER